MREGRRNGDKKEGTDGTVKKSNKFQTKYSGERMNLQSILESTSFSILISVENSNITAIKVETE